MSDPSNIGLSPCWYVVLVCFTLFLGGCMAAEVLKEKPGQDISQIQSGRQKSEIENILGQPVREWMTPAGVCYRVYEYDAGVPSHPEDAWAHILMDIGTLGGWELIAALSGGDEEMTSYESVTEQIAIAFDENDIVIGIFDHFGDFDELPTDGIEQ